MKRRPRDIFIKKMRKEDPLSDTREKLISIYNKGGLSKFEDDLKERMGGTPLSMACLSRSRSKLSKWIYVGESWWCRKIGDEYQFARLMAIYNDDTLDKIEGLWDDRRHITEQPLKIVFVGERCGAIIGHNEFEIIIKWDDMRFAGPYRDLDNLRFEYIEDFDEYKQLISKIKNDKMDKKPISQGPIED